MPDLGQIKQGERGVRDRRGRFVKGRPGNPANNAGQRRQVSSAEAPLNVLR
jgi:hypothetical protein